MQKTVFVSLIAGLVAIGPIAASYAKGASNVASQSKRETTTGMGNAPGSAAAGANAINNPSGNQLMPGAPGGGGHAGGGTR